MHRIGARVVILVVCYYQLLVVRHRMSPDLSVKIMQR